MHILFSVPTGFHARELFIPLRPHFEADTNITKVTIVTPGAPYKDYLFSDYPELFSFVENPATEEAHDQLISETNPDLVITTTSGLDPNDIPLLKAAQKHNVKTLTFIASWDNVWKMERLKNQNRPQVVADHIIVWNQMMKDHVEQIFPDVKPDQIEVIGAPRLDYFFHTDKIPSKQEVLRALDLPDENKKILHFTTTELYPMDYILETVSKNFSKEEYLFLATVHPGGKLDKHMSLEKYGAHVRFAFGRDETSPSDDFRYNPTLQDIYLSVGLFKHADILINHSSTTALESLLAQTPVINVKYGKRFDWWHWYRSMVYRDFKQHYKDITDEHPSKVVTSPSQLTDAIKNYIQDPLQDKDRWSAVLEKMITTTDGSATQKVFDRIKQILTA